MVLTYKQCIEKYGSDYMLKKEMAEGNIFQKEKGSKVNFTDLEYALEYDAERFMGNMSVNKILKRY